MNLLSTLMIPRTSQAETSLEKKIFELMGKSFLVGCLDYAFKRGDKGPQVRSYCQTKADEFVKELRSPSEQGNEGESNEDTDYVYFRKFVM